MTMANGGDQNKMVGVVIHELQLACNSCVKSLVARANTVQGLTCNCECTL